MEDACKTIERTLPRAQKLMLEGGPADVNGTVPQPLAAGRIGLPAFNKIQDLCYRKFAA
jgi:hypothetical protein